MLRELGYSGEDWWATSAVQKALLPPIGTAAIAGREAGCRLYRADAKLLSPRLAEQFRNRWLGGTKRVGHSGACFRQPSSTTGKKTRGALDSSRNLVDLWRTEVSREQVKWSVQILSVFGLDQIYSDDSRPDATGALALMKRGKKVDT